MLKYKERLQSQVMRDRSVTRKVSRRTECKKTSAESRLMHVASYVVPGNVAKIAIIVSVCPSVCLSAHSHV